MLPMRRKGVTGSTPGSGYISILRGVNMPDKDQIIIVVDAEKKKDFRIACINEDVSMTDKLNDLIDEYLKNKE
jgi:hypothetical protein